MTVTYPARWLAVQRPAMNDKRPVFLSSCLTDDSGMRLRIRERVLQETGGGTEGAAASRPIWMAEDYRARQVDGSPDDFRTAELCLEGVRQAGCFVAIVTARHGTRIILDGLGQVPTSFLEAEMFEAAVTRKPAFIYLLKGHEPDGRMASLLQLLTPAFPGMDLTPLSEDEILRRLDRLIARYRRPSWLRPGLSVPRLRTLVDTLFRRRHRPYDPRATLPPLRFLESVRDPAEPPPDPDWVAAILDRAHGQESHQSRLTLAWFAIRSLMGAPYDDPAHRGFLPLWERAFGLWASSGAWYGLHGHFALGCLAALGSQGDVRLRAAGGADPAQGAPHGPLASAYYSIARLAGQPTGILRLALDHVQLGIEANSGDTSNQIAVRASIRLQMGQIDAALQDYQAVAERRRDRGTEAYGQALNEWGYALVKAGQRRLGMAHMEEGLDLLRSGPPSGFQIRAMRKLAVGNARNGKIFRALDLIVEANAVAERIGAHDQINALQRLAAKLRV